MTTNLVIPENKTELDVFLEMSKNNTLAVSGLVGTIKDINENIVMMKDDIHYLKNTSEITEEQCKTIKRLYKSKVMEYVQYPSKYYRKVMTHCINYLKDFHGLGSTIATTQKVNFDKVITGIDNYNPPMEKLKREYDQYLELQK